MKQDSEFVSRLRQNVFFLRLVGYFLLYSSVYLFVLGTALLILRAGWSVSLIYFAELLFGLFLFCF